MKKLGKFLWSMMLSVMSISFIIGILYGVRELKIYLDPGTQAFNIDLEENSETISEDTKNSQELQEKDSKVEEIDQTEEKPEIEEMPETKEKPETEEVVDMAFTGDVLFPDYLLSAYDKEGIFGIISENALDVLKEADIAMINQEFPFSTVGEAMVDKEYTFRIAPSRVEVLNELGVDIVTLANNHALDYGNTALLETLSVLSEADIAYVGAGENLEKAKELKSMDVNGVKVGFLGASRVIPVAGWNATSGSPGMFTTYDPTALVEEITKAKEICDVVIVYVHWGIERNERPEAYQRDLAFQYIDAGADMVVGSHPHVMQGIEYYEGKPIIYSLGNFIFNNSTQKTGILKAGINETGEISLSLVPCTMKNSKMEIMDSVKGKEFFTYLTSISYNVTIDEDGRIIHESE